MTRWTGHSFTDRHLPRAPDHQLTTPWKTLQVLDGSNHKHVVSISQKPSFSLLCSVRRFNSWLYNCVIVSKGQFNIQDTSKRICRQSFHMQSHYSLFPFSSVGFLLDESVFPHRNHSLLETCLVQHIEETIDLVVNCPTDFTWNLENEFLDWLAAGSDTIQLSYIVKGQRRPSRISQLLCCLPLVLRADVLLIGSLGAYWAELWF